MAYYCGQGKTLSDAEGLELVRSRPKAPVRGTDVLESLATDQAIVYQTVTGVRVQTGSHSEYQKHDGDIGAVIPWPLACFTPSVYKTTRSHHAMFTTENTIASQGWICSWPVYIPDGIDYITCRLVFDDAELAKTFHPYVYLGVTGGTGNYYSYYDSASISIDMKTAACSLTYALAVTSTTRLHLLSVYMHQGEHPEEDLYAMLLNVEVAPKLSRCNIRTPDPREMLESDQEDQHRSSSFSTIHESHFADNKPVTSYAITRMARNAGFLYETITGCPVEGKTSLLAEAHNHDGDNSEPIALSLYSMAFGTCGELSNSSFPTQFADGYTTWQCPRVNQTDGSNTFVYVHRFAIWVPERSSGTVSLNWSAVAGIEGTVSGDVTSVRVGVASSPTTSPTYTDTEAFGNYDGVEHIEGTCYFTSNALNHVSVELRVVSSESTWYAGLMGFAVWTEG